MKIWNAIRETIAEKPLVSVGVTVGVFVLVVLIARAAV